VTPALTITINGQPREVSPGTTLAALLEQMNLESRYVAVERNLEVVPRAQHAQCLLGAGDQLEIVTLVGGG
jgi:sulfur carrier protein